MTSPIQQQVRELKFLDGAVRYATENIARALSPIGKTYEVKRASNGAWEARQQALEGLAPQYPLISVTIASMEDSPDFMWNKQALFNGFYLKDKNKPGIIKQLKLSYQKVTLSVTIESENGQEVLDIVKRWKFRERKVQFNVTGEGFQVTCKLLFENAFTFPTQDVGDAGNTFNLASTATLYTYIGECVEIPAIKEVDITFENRSNGKILEQTVVARRRKM